jgi:hypothetical protein
MIWYPLQALLLWLDNMVIAEGAPQIRVRWPDQTCAALTLARKGGLNWQTHLMTSEARVVGPPP